MRKMKDSGIEWIGEIPEEWKALSAKYMVNISNGRDPVKEGNIPVYGSGANSYKTCGEYKEGPAVLVGRKGTIEIPRYIESKYWNIDTAFDVHAYKHGISLKYYYYLAVCFDYKFYLTQTALPSMTQTDYGNMVIPAPDNSDSIAEYLDSKCSEIDGLVSDIEKQITTLEQYKRSVITEAVTKGLDPTVPMKDSGIEWIGEIPEHWGLEKLKYKTKIRNESGKFFPEDKYIGLENVESYTGRYLPTDTVYDEAVYDIYRQGDILFGKLRPYLAKVFITEDNGFCTGEFAVIKDYKGYLRFLFYYLLSDGFLKIVNASTYGAKMPRANWDFIKNLPVPAIPSDEERCIADYLDSKCSEIDSAISLKKQQIEALNDYKKSLIYEYVTGKKEIPA